MDIFDSFATDEKKELEGAWFPLDKTAKILVARSSNTNYIELLRKKLDASGIDLNSTSKEDNAAAESIFNDVFAQTILLGWEGISFKGQPMPYSVENARQLLAIKDFRAKVRGCADNFDAFKAKGEEALGNA